MCVYFDVCVLLVLCVCECVYVNVCVCMIVCDCEWCCCVVMMLCFCCLCVGKVWEYGVVVDVVVECVDDFDCDCVCECEILFVG